MANDKNKIKELVSDDDDPTAELEALAFKEGAVELEADADTSGLGRARDTDASISELKSDLKSRSETIDRLQFDMERLRSKWLGLEAEISARENITDQQHAELAELWETLDRKQKLLRERDKTIKQLKAEIRERHDEQQALHDTASDLRNQIEAARTAEQELDVEGLRASLDEQSQRILELESENTHLTQLAGSQEDDRTRQDRQLIAEQSGQIANNEMLLRKLRENEARLEAYADTLRQQLQDAKQTSSAAVDSHDYLQNTIDSATTEIEQINLELDDERASSDTLRQKLEELQSAHAEEIRMIRFELGEAQETVAQNELITEQLASDLLETRGYRTELENMLSKTEESSKDEIERLERENRKLRRESKEAEEQLATKSEAINCLLAELAKKTQQIESIGEIEDVIHEIDDRISERIDDRIHPDKDRLARMLIGSVEGQELRFPLFKDRLTIGRTEQNDIQLKAAYISRRHAVIATEGDMTREIDWGSKNGVFVNSKRVTEHFLKNGDIVAIGTAKFRYEARPKREG